MLALRAQSVREEYPFWQLKHKKFDWDEYNGTIKDQLRWLLLSWAFFEPWPRQASSPPATAPGIFCGVQERHRPGYASR